MSEIVRGRTRGGYLTIDNYIQDGLLEIGSIDLAGFYGALKRFVDRRESSDGKAMPWTVDMFCSKFKIGKQRFYRLAELLWQVGLLDVEKDFGLINPEKGIMGWRNRYVVHDYPDYDGPLRLVREGSFKYKKKGSNDDAVNEIEEKESAGGDEVARRAERADLDDCGEKDKEGVTAEGGYFHIGIPQKECSEEFPYRNTSESMFGGISTTGIPAMGIPATGIPAVERHIKNKGSKKQDNIKKQEKDNINTSIQPSIHNDKDDNVRAREKKTKPPVDNKDIVEKPDGSVNLNRVGGRNGATEMTRVRSLLKDAGFEGSQVEVDFLGRWVGVFPFEMIEHAVKKSVLNGKKSLIYIRGIFEDWLNKGICSLEQAEKETRYDSVLFKPPEKRIHEQKTKIKLPDPQVFKDYRKEASLQSTQEGTSWTKRIRGFPV